MAVVVGAGVAANAGGVALFPVVAVIGASTIAFGVFGTGCEKALAQFKSYDCQDKWVDFACSMIRTVTFGSCTGAALAAIGGGSIAYSALGAPATAAAVVSFFSLSSSKQETLQTGQKA